MGGLNAIPQEIHGLQLDSQLEKGWVGYMDYNSWDYEHEPEGYQVDNIWYRPDFLLHNVSIIDTKKLCLDIHNADVYLEVKGDPKRLKEAYEKARMMQRNGFHVLIVGRFPYGADDKEIIQNLKKSPQSYWDGPKVYSTYILFLAQRQCGGTSLERKACEDSFLKDSGPRERYDPAIWDMYYHNLKEHGVCPKSPKTFLNNKFLWVGRKGEPVIGNWHTRDDRTDGDPKNTAAAIKYANQIMNYKAKKGGIQDGN